MSWVNWDYVYQSILLRNYTFVDVSIQFLNSNQSGETQFSQPKWTNPYKNAYVYGLGFAEHFGPSHLNLIQSVEIGNEPWFVIIILFYFIPTLFQGIMMQIFMYKCSK